VAQRAKELGPEHPVLTVAHRQAEHFPAAVSPHPGGHHGRPGDHPAPDAGLDVSGIGEHIGELALQRPGPERLEITVELGAYPADLALGDARRRPQRLDQIVD